MCFQNFSAPSNIQIRLLLFIFYLSCCCKLIFCDILIHMEQQGQGSTRTSVSGSTEVINQVSSDKPISNIMKSFPGKGKNMKKNLLTIVLSVGVVLLGVLTGWFLSVGKKSSSSDSKVQTEGVTESETEAGIVDESVFSDSVEGTLVEGGIKGEGTHHLEREGGSSQNVYLTSTVIDLQSFVGKNVKVFGETLSAINAGWLMDVGKIKVVN